MAGELARFVVGGATRPDSLTGFKPEFSSALAQLFAAAPPDIQQNLRISSGYRSPERQAQLWQQALQKYGSESAARKWVAPPGRSNHNHGQAADLKYLSPAAREWAHANAGNFGLAFPLSNENWHIELASARGGGGQPQGNTAVASAPGAPLPPQRPQAGTTLADALPGAVLPDFGILPVPVAAPDANPIALAALQNQERRRQQQEAAEAEQIRKAALFNGVANMFG